MKIILTENVEKLGQAGEVKEVANGYARNFLFPRDLAIPATKGALLEAENRRTSAAKRAASQVNAAQAAADKLRGLTVLLYARTGEQNRLYGAITPADIATALRVQHGQTVDRRRIKIDSSIHRTGNYTATVTLGNNLTAQLNLAVEPESNRTGALTSVATRAPAPPAAPAAAAPAPPEGETAAAPVEAAAASVEAAAPVEAAAASVEAAAPVEAAAAPVEATGPGPETVTLSPVTTATAPETSVADAAGAAAGTAATDPVESPE